MNSIDLLGYIAAFCTTVAFVPQAMRVIRTRDTRSLSLAMYSIFTVGVSFWLCYGLLKRDGAIIAANLLTFALAAVILFNKINNDLLRKASAHSADKSE